MYENIVAAVMAEPWAIMPGKLAVIQEIIHRRIDGQRPSPDEIRAEIEAARNVNRQTLTAGSSVAVIQIVGTLMPRAGLIMESSGAVSVQRLQASLREAINDPEVGHIVLDIDSPGGQVGGIAELASEIYEARETKPITAVANTLAASAAYWLGASASELVVTPSGEVGSIGVFAIHEDMSALLDQAGVKVSLISAGKYKTEGNPFQPLDGEARAAMQARVDDYYDMFTEAVAHGRGVSQADVIEGFGQGRVVGPDQAVRLGMADRVGTIDQVLAGLTGGGSKQPFQADDLERRRRRLRALIR